MPTNVVMPQMGESIAEGTIVRWIKKVGENVDRDEPLFEISTDKVDAEIPSPGAGVLTEIKVKEGETVAVNSVVAVIGGVGEGAVREPPVSTSAPAVATGTASASAADAATAGPSPAAPSPGPNGVPEAAVGQPEAGSRKPEADGRHRSSPLVRRIAKEHNVDIRQINGTGISGRVTKDDILGFIETGPSSAAGAATEGKPQRVPAPTGHVPA